MYSNFKLGIAESIFITFFVLSIGHDLFVFLSRLLLFKDIHLLQNVCPHFTIRGECIFESNIMLHKSHLIKSSIIDLSI